MSEFFNADEAAAEMQRLKQMSWTAAKILREARAERLPVCFDFVGELIVCSVDGRLGPGGSSPIVLDFEGVVRSLTRPTVDGICGFGVLVEIQEAHGLKFSHKDGRLTRGIDLPTEFPHGGRIKTGHKVECWIEDAGVTTDAFLFHTDDLKKLASTAQAALVVPGGERPNKESASEPQEWKALAAKRAAEIIAHDKKKDLYPSQENIADVIAKEFRTDGVVGAGGKPMTAAYIKRHSLRGISSEKGKHLSTVMRRGK